MQILSPSQCSTWLALRAMPDDPYSNPPVGTRYARLIPPKTENGVLQVADALFSSPNPAEVLLQVTDWSHYGSPDEMPLPLQRAQVAITSLFESVGFVFEATEAAFARECCSFAFSSGMSASVYIPIRQLSIHLWEGDFIELWSASKDEIAATSASLVKAGSAVVRK